MLDTKLKKTHKLKNLIIALIVLIPALVLTCLYPQMERAMLDKKEQWHQEWEERKEEYKKEHEEPVASEETETSEGVQVMTPVEETATEVEITESDTDENTAVSAEDSPEALSVVKEFYLYDDFINYAIETSYYQYAMLLQDATGTESFTDVLDQHGWINDYYEFIENTPSYAKYVYEDETGEQREVVMSETQKLSHEEGELLEELFLGEALGNIHETQMRSDGYLGYLSLAYDSYGRLADIRLNVDERVDYEKGIYPRAKNSIAQYENNANFYLEENQLPDRESEEMVMQVCPKNFQAVYLIYQDNERFVNDFYEIDGGHSSNEDSYYENGPYYVQEDLYLAIGAYWIVAALAVFVFLAAMILPFFKKLETGWEKLFSMPTEIALCVAAAGIALAVGMCILMSYTTMDAITKEIITEGHTKELLGYAFSVEQCYYIMLGVNFLGWALAFFMEYICAAQLRQFFARPKYYIRHRILCVILICWFHKKVKGLVNLVLDIDIHQKLHKSIVKIVLANFVIVALLCCIWFAGILGAIIYSVVLYILLKKYGSKLQRQYQSILDATGQMADGDLHITLEEDLGVFAPLGQELEGVQKGFAKAVAEEAKSQNMKSELITNVSHDLKTPLTAIITYVDLLKKEDITEEERQSYIETLDIKSQRLKVLIEDLFEVSKANSGNVKMNFLEVDIVKLMKEVRVELADKIEQSNLDFRWNLPEEKVFLNLDGQRTYRIFENLLNNAIKYAMPFTRVYVDILNKESEVVITFKNMSAQELNFDADHLTERFVRGDSSRNSEGSGLGLAIAKSFTELQNGRFEVQVDGDLFKVIISFMK